MGSKSWQKTRVESLERFWKLEEKGGCAGLRRMLGRTQSKFEEMIGLEQKKTGID